MAAVPGKSSMESSQKIDTSRPPMEKRRSDASTHSPARHHQRRVSSQRTVKETYNARAEYSTSQDDGASQRRINQYLIQEEIGRGSFGAVHIAVDQFGTEYAVKEFSKARLRKRAKSNLLRQARQQNRNRYGHASPGIKLSDQQPQAELDHSFNLIKEEIAIMKKLNHENLVSLYEVLDDPEEDSLYMVLEMCRKGVVMKIEMDEQAEPKDDQTCRYLFRDLMLGIEYLHAQGVIHRDIKPDNCLLTADDTLKIVDFGVSEMFEKTDEMKIAKSAGSPAFMAPELCEIRKEGVDGRPADIWSMGVTLYCLKFGRVPFEKHAVLELYQSIISDPVEIDPECDPQLADLLVRLLEKDPNTRITMNEIRVHPWVTQDGTDTLLSAEENCANSVAPPTEEEKETAITNNMGGLITVLKAANKFKGLLQHKHPELMESILNRASRMVQPPLSMTIHEAGSEFKKDVKGFFRSSKAKQGLEIASPDDVPGSGIYRNTDVTHEIGRMKEQVKQHFSRISRQQTVDARIESYEGPEDTKELSQARNRQQEEESFLRRHSAGLEQHITREYFEDPLFLDIGQGPQEGENSEHDFVVSESPPATDVSIFQQAYNEEAEKIRKSGSDATIFLTRRVDGQNKPTSSRTQAPGTSSSEASSANDSKRVRVSDLVERARQAADNKVQNAKDKMSG